MIRRARSKRHLARHTNQQVWKFVIGSDKAGGVNYTHLTLENSLEPATAKTSLTIAGIYDTNDQFTRRVKILNNMTRQFSKLNMKHRVNLKFPELNDVRLLELHNFNESKGKQFIWETNVSKETIWNKQSSRPGNPRFALAVRLMTLDPEGKL